MEQSLFGPPNTIRIPYDDHRFRYVGRLADREQFMAFATGTFPEGVKLSLSYAKNESLVEYLSSQLDC